MNGCLERMQKVEEFLKNDRQTDLYLDIVELLRTYAKKVLPQYVGHLVGEIGNIAATTINKANQELKYARNAISDMIDLENIRKTPERFVAFTISPIMEIFPDAKITGHSQIQKEFFNEFKENLKKYQDRYIDSDWALHVVKCNDYLKKVLEN